MKISFLLFAALAGAPSLLAQEATPPLVPDVPHSQTILDTLVNAGPVMIPLFLLSIFSVALVIVYLMTIRRGAVVSSGYMATADALLRKRDYLGLLAVSNRHGEAIARVVQKILDFTTKNPHADFQQLREIAETVRRSLARDQSGAGEHGRRAGHRYSGDDVLRFFPRKSPKVDLGIGSCFHACFGFAFVAVRQAGSRANPCANRGRTISCPFSR